MSAESEGPLSVLHERGGLRARCPACGSLAINRYGKSHSGKQRYICLMCERQFIPGSERLLVRQRPLCPVCGQSMYLYRTHMNVVRFRCSLYPHCRTYLKKESHAVGEMEGDYQEVAR
jgi:transposase-like protein